MSCCCSKSFAICDLVICDDADLVLPVPVLMDGTHTLELEFLGDIIRKTADLSIGDNATFDKTNLNERFTYVGRVLDPNGDVLKFTIDDVEYDCFEFTTKRVLV